MEDPGDICLSRPKTAQGCNAGDDDDDDDDDDYDWLFKEEVSTAVILNYS